MKLNYRRTVLVGLAFFSICAFWQMYNNVIPLILTNTFHVSEAVSGVIMAADNVLALFLLPLFGAVSDRSRCRMGRRMPFILAGTVGAVVLMQLLPLLDDSYAAAPAPWKTAAFVGVLGALLVVMGTYRSPAVALMPDVTVKPLRSRGNAVINLMGALGGILYLLVASVLYSAKATDGLAHVSYVRLFAVVGVLMAVAVAVLALTIREPALAAQAAAWEKAHPSGEETTTTSGTVLTPPVRRSLGFLLSSIALWYIGYNAVETWFTTYASRVWDMSLGEASLCLTVATGGAIVSYLPVGALASRIGRKKTILAGVAMLTACFFTGFLFTLTFDRFSPVLYGLFALVGLAWAAINVNSLPMVVELCSGADVGKFTGYYYTFSMAAQTVTPILAGWLLKYVSYTTLCPYAALFAGLSFFTMLQVRHGDSQASRRRGLEAFEELEM